MKNVFFRVINKVITHNEFKYIHHQAFKTVANPSQQNRLIENSRIKLSSIYDELQHSEVETPNTPIFITARFRSGSTLLWNLFRHINGIHSYYEPLNERKWFDKNSRQGHTDESHKGVSDYWTEYDHIKNVGHLFSKDWTTKSLLMDQSSLDSNMHQYIDELITQAPERPVLQFNRMDFRLQWLKANFPQANIIHLYRHPRDHWISVSSKSAAVPLDLSSHDFKQYNLFYTMEWAQDLTYVFPFLDPALRKHPYYYHYLLWRLSYIYGKSFSDISIAFEDLIQNSESTLANIFNCINMNNVNIAPLKKCVQKQQFGKWKTYADEQWFQTIELECNKILSNYFQS